MFGTKRFKTNPVLDPNLNPLPETLKLGMELISQSFNSAHMRNLNLMDTTEQKLYGFMTNYEGSNFCWIQPTRVKNNTPEVGYHRYLKRINNGDRVPFENLEVGLDCIARYENDGNWYRAIIVEKPTIGDCWLVLFVDYGNFQRCNRFSIARPINEPDCDHYHTPLQAVCCRLYNIVAKNHNDREHIDLKLENFYAKHSSDFLEIVVKSIRPDYVVDCDVFLCRKGAVGANRLCRRHIGQDLVDKGIAYFADPVAAHALSIPSPQAPCITILDEEEDKTADVKKENVKMETDVKEEKKVKQEMKVKQEEMLVKQEVKRERFIIEAFQY